jgi:hypothetical protein
VDVSLAVGTGEEHLVHFHFNQFWGSLRIDVDGKPVVKDFRMFPVSTMVKCEFLVGSGEQHNARIEKTRRRIFGDVRKQAYRVYIDGTPQRES